MSAKYNLQKYGDIHTHVFFRPTGTNDLEDIKTILESDDNIRVYPNSEDMKSYYNVADYIHRLIVKSEFLCKGINPEYVDDSFKQVDAVVVIGSSNILPNGNLFGFALIKFDEHNNAIYIDVICSHIGIKGAGEFLLKTLEHIGRTLLMTEIYLTSVKTAITFYEKYGYIKIHKSCEQMCLMLKSIRRKEKSSSSPKKKLQTQRRSPSKAKRTRSRSPKK
jgi:hypothetical protein